MTEPLISLPEVEKEGAAAFEHGKAMCMHAMPTGFAFNPYPQGSVLHANWMEGYVAAWRVIGKRK
ncbi:hypothetical protein [Cupriavidus sp. DL-D2]|uniref:hypothetical protein n=1 Tax=Cupriavidus sp. DL-D2 TaxID=3144974 RepID=UPI003213A6F0